MMATPSVVDLIMIGLSSLVSIIILVFIHAFFLWLVTAKLLNFEENKFITSLKVATVVSVGTLLLSVFPAVGVVFMSAASVLLIIYFFQVNWKKAVIAWLITTLLVIAIIIGVAMIYLAGALTILEKLAFTPPV